MAEGRGIEPRIPDGKPRLSKPAQCHSASLPRWCSRQDSNLHYPRSERGDSASWPTRAWWSEKESNLRCLPYGWQFYRLLLSPLSDHSANGADGWTRTSTGQALNLLTLPNWPTSALVDHAGVEPALSHVLSMVPLPAWASGPKSYSVVGGGKRGRTAKTFEGRLFSRQVGLPAVPDPSAKLERAQRAIARAQAGT